MGMMWGRWGQHRVETMETTAMGTTWGPSGGYGDNIGWRPWRPQPWGPHGDLLGAMETMWGRRGDNRDDVGTMWGQRNH